MDAGRNVADQLGECDAERLAQLEALEAKVAALAEYWRRLAEKKPATPAGEAATRTLEACAHDLAALLGFGWQ